MSVDGELGDLSGLSDLLAGLLGGDTTLSVDGELGDLSGLSEILAGLLGGDTTLSVDGELGDLSGLSDLLAGLLGGDTTLSVDGTSDLLSSLSGLSGLSSVLSVFGGSAATSGLDLSAISSLLGGLTGGTASTGGIDLSSLSSLLGGLTGGTASTGGLDLSSILSALTGGGTTLSVDGSTASTSSTNILSVLGNLGGLGNLFSGLTGILSGIGSGDLDGFELLDSLTDLYNGSGISVDGGTSSTGSTDLLSGLLGGNGLSSLLSGLLGGGTSLSLDGTTASTGGIDLSSLSSLLGGLTGGTASTGGLDLSSILSALTGGGTTLSVDGSTASTSSTNILSVLGNLGGLGNLFSGLTGILSGIGSGDLDGFELLDSLTDLYNGSGISVDGGTSSTGSTDLLSGLLGGNGLSSLLSGLLGGGTASTGGIDLSSLGSLSLLSALLGGGTASTGGLDLSSILSALTGGGTTLSVDGTTASTSASDTTSTNSTYNIIGLVNLISEYAALNGDQDVSSSSGVVIQISDDSWNMMRTTSVLNFILPGQDIYVNSDGTQGIVISTDIDSLQAALKPYNDYITVDDLAIGLSITIDDFDGIQKAVALAKEDSSAPGGSETIVALSTIDLAKIESGDDSPSDPASLANNAFDEIPNDAVLPLLLTSSDGAFQVEFDSLREVGFWLDDASMDMGAQNWDGWDIRAIGDFQGDGVDDLLLSHSQTGIMVMLADGDLSKWDSLDQFVTDDPLRGAIPADAGVCMVGDASQWLESGEKSANWIILA